MAKNPYDPYYPWDKEEDEADEYYRRAFENRPRVGLLTPRVPPKPPPPPPEPIPKVQDPVGPLRIRVVEDSTGKPIPNVKISFWYNDLPPIYTNDDGIAENPYAPGKTYIVECPPQGFRLTEILDFVGEGETPIHPLTQSEEESSASESDASLTDKDKKSKSSTSRAQQPEYKIAHVIEYKLKTGDSFMTACRKGAGLNPMIGAYFNWGVRTNEEIQEKLRDLYDSNDPKIIYLYKKWEMTGVLINEMRTVRVRKVFPKTVKQSITGLPFFPALYGIAPADFKPSIPPDISGERVTDVAIDRQRYEYGLRLVRPGYLYLFYEQGASGKDYWEVYTVNDDGSMTRQADPKNVAASRRYLVIEKPEQCGTVWIAFSEHQWSTNTLDNYAHDAAMRGTRMQSFEPVLWLAAPQHPHATEATPANLEHLLEYRQDIDALSMLAPSEVDPVSKNEIGEFSTHTLNKQSSRYPVTARNGKAKDTVLQMQASGCGPNGETYPPVLFALWDAIGIAHELNGYRSEVSGRIEQYQTERSLQVSAMEIIDRAQIALANAAEQKIQTRANLAQTYTESHQYGPKGIEALRLQARRHPEPLRSHYLETADLYEEWEPYNVPSYYTRQLNQELISSLNPGWLNPETRPALEAKRTEHITKLISEVEHYLATRDSKMAQEIKDRRAEAWPKYEKLIDRNGPHGLETFRKNYQSFLDAAGALLEARTVELIKWLEAPLLLDTLQDYDQTSLACGVEFENVISTAIMGIGDCKSGSKKLDDWVKELRADAKSNLLWRAFALNQTAIATEVNAVLAEANARRVPFTEKEFAKSLASIKWAKSAANLYKKSVSFYNNNTKASSTKGSKAFGVALKSSTVLYLDRLAITAGNHIYKFFKIDKLGDTVGEKLMVHLFNVRATIHPEQSWKFIEDEVRERIALRTQALRETLARQKARLNARNYKKLSKTIKRQLNAIQSKDSASRLTLELQTEARNNSKSTLSQLWGEFLGNPDKADDAARAIKDRRLAVIVGLIEMGNLTKLLAWDMAYSGKTDWRTASQVFASCMSIGSSITDVAAITAKSVFGSDSWSHQRLKLFGGIFSCGATAVGVVLDGVDTYKEFKRGRSLFMWLYFAKTGLGLFSLGITALSAFTYAAPLITGKAVAKGTLVAKIVGRRVWFMSLGRVNAAIFAIQLLQFFLDDDALEKWCDRCAFRKNLKNDPYGDGEKQTKAFYEALYEVI